MATSFKQCRTGPADLLRAWQQSEDATELAQAAELLGFRSTAEVLKRGRRPATPPRSSSGQHHIVDALEQAEKPPTAPDDRPPSPVYFVEQRTRQIANEGDDGLPNWVKTHTALTSDDIYDPHSAAPAWQALTRKPRLQSALRQHLKHAYLGSEPDIAKLLSRIARGRPLRKLPMQTLARRVRNIHIVVDESRHLRTMLEDARNLYYDLCGQWGPKRVSWQNAQRDPQWPVKAHHLKQGTTWIIASDLGAYGSANQRRQWQRLLLLLRKKSINSLILAPLSKQALQALAVKGLHAHSWDQRLQAVRGQSVAAVLPDHRHSDSSSGEAPSPERKRTKLETEVSRLIASLSFTYRVEPALLRAMRMHLGLSASAEALCRLHQDIRDDGWCLYLKQAAQVRYRTIFAQNFDDQQQDAAVSLVKRHHANQPQSILDQELDTANSLCNNNVAGFEESKTRLRRLAVTFDHKDKSHLLRCWVQGQLDTQSGDDPERSAHFFQALHRDAINRGNTNHLRLPKGVKYRHLAPYLSIQKQRLPITIAQTSEGLLCEWAEPDSSPSSARSATQRGKLVIAQSTVVGENLVVDDKILRLGGAHNNQLSLSEFSTPMLIDTGTERLTINATSTMQENWIAEIGRDHTGAFLTPKQDQLPAHYRAGKIQFPAWGGSLKHDQFGVYTELELDIDSRHSIRQAFRWIPAGQFMMGSPASEPYRRDNESLHSVTLSSGFWLADTACSQGVWQALMGDNPSHFTLSDEHPVEKVSWQDVQEFIQRLNQRVPVLNARLPTEAQWEYACRAGTTTAFNFGNNISSEQVNFDGNYPYASSDKSQYRAQTLPVNELNQNAWGLLQMHGNVWEWCQDEWRYDLGTDDVTDPPMQVQGDGSAGEQSQRVLRGGSWNNNGRLCRSAIRSLNTAGYRNDLNGFRLALGHELQPSAGGASKHA